MSDESPPLDTAVAVESLSLREWLELYWGLAWRGIVTTLGSLVVSMLFGMITGAAGGLVIGLSGASMDRFRLPLQVLGGAIGLVVGFGFFTVWFKWILRARFGSLRLLLVRGRNQGPSDVAIPPAV